MTEQDIKAKILSALPAHIGYDNLLCQLDGDQGDGLQREGELHILLAIIGDQDLSQTIYAIHPNPDTSFEILETHFGWYRRSAKPGAPAFESDDRQTSRDQMAVAKIGMGASGLFKRLWAVSLAQLLRLTFHQNYWSGTGYQIPDVLTPDEAATSLRGLIGPFSLFTNLILDLGFLIDLVIRKYNQSTNNSGAMWGWDNMYAINLLAANWMYPTLWSQFAMDLYLKTDFMAQLWGYHKDQDGNNGCELLYWLYRLAFLKQYGYSPSDAP